MHFPEAAGPTTYTYYQKATVEKCEKQCTDLSGCTVFSFGDYGCRVPVYKAKYSAVNDVFTKSSTGDGESARKVPALDMHNAS